MLVFSTHLVNYCPSSLLSGSPPPLPCVKVQFIQTVCGWEGVMSPVGDHILLEFNTLYLTRFRTYKIARPTKQGKGHQTDKHLPQLVGFGLACAPVRTRLFGFIATPNGALRAPPHHSFAASYSTPKSIYNLSNLGRPRPGLLSFQ
jgi:hypothetical protein